MKIGETIDLISQKVEIVKCQECSHAMVNLDADDLRQGDLTTLKTNGVRISNPETSEPICLNCEIERPFKKKVNDYFKYDHHSDDSHLFGGNGFGGSFGGFGGFGGGSFSGGGATRSF